MLFERNLEANVFAQNTNTQPTDNVVINIALVILMFNFDTFINVYCM